MKHYFSFDVESLGLFGVPFVYGYVVVDETGKEQECGCVGVNILSNDLSVGIATAVLEDWSSQPNDAAWVKENVLPALPDQWATCKSIVTVFESFGACWRRCQETYPNITMVTDCPFPVESGFLSHVAKRLGWTMQDSPYPIIDVASVLFACGLDPAAHYERLPNELPAHNPVNDARQSVRIMLETMQRITVEHDTDYLGSGERRRISDIFAKAALVPDDDDADPDIDV